MFARCGTFSAIWANLLKRSCVRCAWWCHLAVVKQAGSASLTFGADTRRGDLVQIVLAGQVAVPGAYGRPLRNRPLLRGLPARTDNAPYLLPAPRGKHGFQMDIGAAACKAGADGVRIKLFHISNHTSFEPVSQGLRLLIKSTSVKDAAEKYLFYRQGGAFLTFY